MKNIFTLLAATTAISLAGSAYAADESAKVKSDMEYKKNGGYEASRSAERTNASGTKHKSEAKVDVDVDSDGKTDKTVKSESSSDPKGLWNKKTNTSKTEVEDKERGGYKATTKNEHADRDGTSHKTEKKTDVDVDSDGDVTTTTTTEKTSNPKGLMNETTTKTKTKSVNGRVVESTKDHD